VGRPVARDGSAQNLHDGGVSIAISPCSPPVTRPTGQAGSVSVRADRHAGVGRSSAAVGFSPYCNLGQSNQPVISVRFTEGHGELGWLSSSSVAPGTFPR
jgi:hypothetical protein